MNTSEWLTVAGIVVTVLIVMGGGLYLRGQLDAHAEIMKKAIGDLETKVDALEGGRTAAAHEQGAQEVRNQIIARLDRELGDARSQVMVATNNIARHEADCVRRYTEIADHLTRVHAALDGLRGQINNIATGKTGKIFEVRTALEGEH